MLRGILWCGTCGVRYTTQSSHAVAYKTLKDGTKKRYKLASRRRRYACTYAYQKRAFCKHKWMGAKTIEGRVWEKVVQFLTDPSEVRSLMEDRQRQIEETGTMPELEQAKVRLERVDAERRKLANAYLGDLLTEEELEHKRRSVVEKWEYYTSEVERLEVEAQSFSYDIKALEDFITGAAAISARLENPTDEEKAEIAQLVVSRVTVYDDDIQISMMSTAPESVGLVTNERQM